jgi:hypothetical protein
MNVGEITVTLSSGEATTLGVLCENGPVALAFLRHAGCVFCRQHVAELRTHPELHVIFVLMVSPDEADQFRTKLQSPHRFIADPDRKLAEHFQVPRGSLGQLFGPEVIKKGFQATRDGHRGGTIAGDVRQMPTMVVLDERANVVWTHHGRNAADNVGPDEIQAHLGQAAQANGQSRKEASPIASER